MEFNSVPDSGVESVGKSIAFLPRSGHGCSIPKIAKITILTLITLTTLFALNPAKASAAPIDAEKISKSETTARNAALKNLRKKILGLKLTSSLTVEDFAGSSPEVRDAVSKWLASIKKRGKVTAGDNGVVTVTIAVSMKAIQIRLTGIYASYYDGKKIKPSDINNIAETNNSREVRATGTSTPAKKKTPTPVEKIPDIPTLVPGAAPAVAPEIKTPAVPVSQDCWNQDLIPQHVDKAKLLAELSAKKNALSRLGQRMRNVKIGEINGKKLTVNDFVVNSAQPDVDMSEFMRAATRTQLTLRSDMLVCEIQMQAELKPAIAILKNWADENYKGDQKNIQLLRDYVEKQKPETITEVGFGVVEPKYVKERFVNQQKRLVDFASKPPQWISETMQVTGEAAINDKKPFVIAKNEAIIAANTDGEKKLQATLLGLVLKVPGNSSISSVKNVAAKSPDFAEKLKNVEKEVQLVDDPQLDKDKIVRVIVSTKLRPVWDMLLVNQSK